MQHNLKLFRIVNDVEAATLPKRVRNSSEHIEITIDAEDYYRIKDYEKNFERV